MRFRGAVGHHRLRTVLALALVASAAHASAQDRLLVGGQERGAIGNFGRVLGPGPQVTNDDIFGGGRFALRRSASSLEPDRLLDARTGAVTDLDGFAFFGDRARPVVFLARPRVPGAFVFPDSLWAVNVVTGAEQRLFGWTAGYAPQCAHAYSVNVVFCGEPGTNGSAQVFAVDVATGNRRVVGPVPVEVLPPGQALQSWSPMATPDGRRIYFDGPAPGRLAMLDTATGAVTLASDAGSRYVLRRVWDDANERLIVSGQSASISFLTYQVAAYAKDLTPLGRATTELPADVQISQHTGRLYTYQYFVAYKDYSSIERLAVFDSTTYAPLAPPSVRTGFNLPSGWALLAPPGPPRDLTATVDGGTVTLAWTNVGAAAGFVLDAGAASGRTDVTAYLGPDPRAVFTNVPPGTYYVRIRGGNEFGGGRPSGEIRVVVP